MTPTGTERSLGSLFGSTPQNLCNSDVLLSCVFSGLTWIRLISGAGVVGVRWLRGNLHKAAAALHVLLGALGHTSDFLCISASLVLSRSCAASSLTAQNRNKLA